MPDLALLDKAMNKLLGLLILLSPPAQEKGCLYLSRQTMMVLMIITTTMMMIKFT